MTYLTTDRVAAIDAMARSRYERLDSHFTMPGGLSWEAYKAEDPLLADLYLSDAAADLDALTASGAVIDASTLADDETLIERLARAIAAADDEALERTNFEHLTATYDEEAQAVLRALSAALTERSQR